MTKPASAINTEFDSRILRVSSGFGGITRPHFVGLSNELETVACLNCGKVTSAVTAGMPAALKGMPGVMFVCDDCDAKIGELPTHATSFVRYKES